MKPSKFLKKLVPTPLLAEYEFPSSLTSAERAFVHGLVVSHGLKSKSHGKGVNRALKVYKDTSTAGLAMIEGGRDARLSLTLQSAQAAHLLLLNSPLTTRERDSLARPSERAAQELEKCPAMDVNRTTIGKLYGGIPQVPDQSRDEVAASHRRNLPIWPKRQAIIDAISNNQVVIIKGGT